MGVRGLTTFVNNHDSFLKSHSLHDTNLVIDGHSLCAQLFSRISNSFPAFGGNYDKCAAIFKNFFKSLKKCKVNCFVLFDGSYETRKVKTVLSRLKSKIAGASHLDPVTQRSLQIFPLLLRDAFREVLEELNISFSYCEFEADDEIAALARYLNCPVLSYDSDFFIYNVYYIPFNTLDTIPVLIEQDGEKFYALECKLYKSEYLAQKFGLNADMMPLLATLLGNDFVQKRMFKKFFSHLKLPKNRSKKNDEQRSIQALFAWLKNETLESAITKIIGRVKKGDKKKILQIIEDSIEGYNCKYCKSIAVFGLGNISNDFPVNNDDNIKHSSLDSSKHVLKSISKSCQDGDEDQASDAEESSSKDGESSDDEGSVDELKMPEWLSDRLRRTIVPKTYINLYTLCIYLCIPQAEDYTSEDSFLPTLPILRYAFDILTDFSNQDCIYVSRELNNNYKKMVVGPEYAIERPITRNYSDLSLPELHIYITHFIKLSYPSLELNLIEMLPANFKLIILSIFWWVKYCDAPKNLVHSVLISYIMLDVIDEKTGTFRGAYFFNNKFCKKLEDLKKRSFDKVSVDGSNLFLNKNKVAYEDCLVACSVLLQHFDLSPEIKKKPKSYDIRIIHSLAQFQCCLLQFNSLNSLSNFAYESTKYSKCYNGTFIYNLSCKVGSAEPQVYFEQYLKGAHTVLMFYKSICYVLDKCLEQLGLGMGTAPTKKKKRKKKSVKDDDVTFLVKEFESEVYI